MDTLYVVFHPIAKKCVRCDHGSHNLPLVEGKVYQVVEEFESEYLLMGWGSMRFHKGCFVRAPSGAATTKC